MRSSPSKAYDAEQYRENYQRHVIDPPDGVWITTPPYTLPPRCDRCPVPDCPSRHRVFKPYWRLNEHMKYRHGWPRRNKPKAPRGSGRSNISKAEQERRRMSTQSSAPSPSDDDSTLSEAPYSEDLNSNTANTITVHNPAQISTTASSTTSSITSSLPASLTDASMSAAIRQCVLEMRQYLHTNRRSATTATTWDYFAVLTPQLESLLLHNSIKVNTMMDTAEARNIASLYRAVAEHDIANKPTDPIPSPAPAPKLKIVLKLTPG